MQFYFLLLFVAAIYGVSATTDCKDAIHDCRRFLSACKNTTKTRLEWVRKHCQASCGLCSAVPEPEASTRPEPTEAPPPTCENCSTLPGPEETTEPEVTEPPQPTETEESLEPTQTMEALGSTGTKSSTKSPLDTTTRPGEQQTPETTKTTKQGVSTTTDCKDAIHDCRRFLDVCKSTSKPRLDWALKNCRASCGMCSTGPGVSTTTDCKDAIHDCRRFLDVCKSTSKARLEWARKYCQSSCGMCSSEPGPEATSVPQFQTGVSGATDCKDAIHDCKRFLDVCKSTSKPRLDWALKNCRASCGMCSTGPAPEASTRPGPTEAPPSTCENCSTLPGPEETTEPEVTEQPQPTETEESLQPTQTMETLGSTQTESSTKSPLDTTTRPGEQQTSETTNTTEQGPNCPGRSLTQAQRQMIIDDHNKRRSNIANGKEYINNAEGYAPSGKNMYKLSWDCELESSAQHWAETCPRIDSGNPHSKGNHGENLYWRWTSGPANIDDELREASSNWWKELQDYGMGRRDFILTNAVASRGVLHFTQMAWGRTIRVGCGVSTTCQQQSYPTTIIVCCQYSVKGNTISESIYELGPPCRSDSDCTTYNGSTCESSTGLCMMP